MGPGHLRPNAKVHGKNSPIALNFGSIADMRLLGQALTQAAEAWKTLATQENTDAEVSWAADTTYSDETECLGDIDPDVDEFIWYDGLYVCGAWKEEATEANTNCEEPYDHTDDPRCLSCARRKLLSRLSERHDRLQEF